MVDPEDAEMSGNDVIECTTPLPGPHGLGGMLWLFGVPLMLWGTAMLSLLPLAAWHFVPAKFNAERASAIASGMTSAEFNFALIEELPRILMLLSSIVLAEAFFRRSQGFRWISTIWLVALCLLQWHDGWIGLPPIIGLHGHMDMMLGSITGTAFAVPILYLWLSRRARNTFSNMEPPPRRRGWQHVFFDGPRDWGGGVWFIAGVIVLLSLTHATLAMEYWPRIFHPQLTPGIAALLDAPAAPKGEGNAASALIAMSYLADVSQVPYARWSLAQHVPGLLLALWSSFLFARRSPLLKWTLLGSALLHVSSQITGWMMRDDVFFACFDCSSPGHGLDNAIANATVVSVVLLLPAVRRRFHGNTTPPL